MFYHKWKQNRCLFETFDDPKHAETGQLDDSEQMDSFWWNFPQKGVIRLKLNAILKY